jgi:HK97 family phage prohead protease
MRDNRYKSCNLKVENSIIKSMDDKQGLVEFYFASFDTLDSDGDVIEKGAFDETLALVKENTHRARIKHFKNHDPSQVPGVIKDFYIDDKGVVAVSQLATTTLGVDTLKEYEAGIITEHSQGFQIMDEEYDNMEGVNRIKKIKLWEVSSLTHWGANKNTPTVGVKSEKDILSLMQKMNHVLRNGTLSDERCEEILIEYNKLGETLKSLNKSYGNLDNDDEKNQEIINRLINTFKN